MRLGYYGILGVGLEVRVRVIRFEGLVVFTSIEV